jgi:hypothetical protein
MSGRVSVAGWGYGHEQWVPGEGLGVVTDRPAGYGRADRLRVPARLIKQAAGRVVGVLR